MITRIRELLEIRQLSPTQFADLIGVGRPVISHILSERNKPSLEVVQKIIGAFPEVSLPWLLAGTGPMLAAPAANTPPTPAVSDSLLPNAGVAAPAPAATPAPFVAPAAVPMSPTRSTAAAQPTSYPQPPKFRPAASSYVPAPELVPVPAVASATVEPAVTAFPLAVPVAEASPAPAAPQEPSLPLPPAVAPVANVTPDATANAVAPVAESSTFDFKAASPSTNPAAALSFLGEPGKAIRRIVIFYRDGSFSDYLPEGH